MTINQLCEPYLRYCQVERFHAPETLSKTQDCFRAWLCPVLGDIPLEELRIEHVAQLRDSMFRRQLSPARHYSVLSALKGLLRYCQEVRKIKTLEPANVQLPQRGKPDVTVLTSSELKALFAEISTRTFNGARLRALIELLLATGMRISEALSLDREPIEAGADQAEIVGKGGKRRTVFFTPRALFWLRHYLTKRHDEHPALFVTTGFPARRLAREDISRFFVRLRERAGIRKPVTPHVLRHTYCSNLLANGADIMFIKELAGHESIQTTAKYYLKVTPAQLQQVVRKHLDYGFGDNTPLTAPAA